MSTREFLRTSPDVLPLLPTSPVCSDLDQDLPAQPSSPASSPSLRRNSFLVLPPLPDSSPEYSDLRQEIPSESVNTTSVISLRGRHSIESKSLPASSPSRRSPPREKQAIGRDLPKLKVSPIGYKYNGSVFYELFNSILAFWDEKFYDVLCAYYDNTNDLSRSLRRLGFDDDVVNGMLNMLSLFFAEFGKEVIEIVLSMETIETFATILLNVEVERFSKEMTEGDDDASSSSTPLDTVPSLFPFTPNTESTSSDPAAASGQSATASTTPASPSWITVGKKRKQKGKSKIKPIPPPPSLPKDASKEATDSSSVTMKYPEWLMELHKIATEKGVTVIFTDEDPARDNLEHILPPFEYWPPNVEHPTVDIYHACAISTRYVRDLTSILTSFIIYGVRQDHRRGNRVGFLSSRPAAYFTNSYLYARFWPHLKNGFENYLNADIPRPSMLICCLRLDSEEFFGGNGGLSTARITTSDRDILADVSLSTNTSLIMDQFVRTNLNQKSPPPSRLPIPGMGNWTKDADIIVSGLTREMDDIERTDVGNFLQYTHHLRHLSFAAACTEKAIDYMKRHTTKIVVLGFGNGKIGKHCSAADFGTAGIARGCRDYRWSS